MIRTCEAEIDAVMQDNVEVSINYYKPYCIYRVLTHASKRSGRKRAREMYWSEILAGTNMLIPDNEDVTPEQFAALKPAQQDLFF